MAVLDGSWGKVGKGEDLDAPRRLYYVAMTRARKTLTLARMASCQNSLLVALSDDASTLHREPVDLPNPPFELERRYVCSTLRDIDMGFSGRYAPNNLVHQAIRSLTAGSSILLRETEGRMELTDAKGIVVGRMSRSFTIPRGTQFIFGRIAAIIVRKREDSGAEYQSQTRCDSWEIVVPELVFAPNI